MNENLKSEFLSGFLKVAHLGEEGCEEIEIERLIEPAILPKNEIKRKKDMKAVKVKKTTIKDMLAEIKTSLA